MNSGFMTKEGEGTRNERNTHFTVLMGASTSEEQVSNQDIYKL